MAAIESCCVCGSSRVTYHNYLDQPFCWPCANPPPRPRLRVYFEPRDAWIGAYIAKDAVYVCPLPFLVVRWWRNPARSGIRSRLTLLTRKAEQ